MYSLGSQLPHMSGRLARFEGIHPNHSYGTLRLKVDIFLQDEWTDLDLLNFVLVLDTVNTQL
jgi:hypothetical protein